MRKQSPALKVIVTQLYYYSIQASSFIGRHTEGFFFFVFCTWHVPSEAILHKYSPLESLHLEEKSSIVHCHIKELYCGTPYAYVFVVWIFRDFVWLY